jgi:lysine-ketoglutarate reductase/saccharopine dehydrogenase-like protein (TIGR00300 family)
MQVVVGHQGIRVAPLQRSTARTDMFEFISSKVSAEKPKSAIIRELARELQRTREENGKILFVGGPAIVQAGAAEYFQKLIERDFVQVLFAGNAFAAEDIEQALFPAASGATAEQAALIASARQNNLRAINAIRSAGGIRKAVAGRVLEKGIMHSCVKHRVDFVLAGSIRDEGPLPDVITDAIEAQQAMRSKIDRVTIAVMMATKLHSIAVENILPATVRMLCVDINPAVITRLTSRGNFQAVGLVTDVESFLRELSECVFAGR